MSGDKNSIVATGRSSIPLNLLQDSAVPGREGGGAVPPPDLFGASQELRRLLASGCQGEDCDQSPLLPTLLAGGLVSFPMGEGKPVFAHALLRRESGGIVGDMIFPNGVRINFRGRSGSDRQFIVDDAKVFPPGREQGIPVRVGKVAGVTGQWELQWPRDNRLRIAVEPVVTGQADLVPWRLTEVQPPGELRGVFHEGRPQAASVPPGVVAIQKVSVAPIQFGGSKERYEVLMSDGSLLDFQVDVRRHSGTVEIGNVHFSPLSTDRPPVPEEIRGRIDGREIVLSAPRRFQVSIPFRPSRVGGTRFGIGAPRDIRVELLQGGVRGPDPVAAGPRHFLIDETDLPFYRQREAGQRPVLLQTPEGESLMMELAYDGHNWSPAVEGERVKLHFADREVLAAVEEKNGGRWRLSWTGQDRVPHVLWMHCLRDDLVVSTDPNPSGVWRTLLRDRPPVAAAPTPAPPVAAPGAAFGPPVESLPKDLVFLPGPGAQQLLRQEPEVPAGDPAPQQMFRFVSGEFELEVTLEWNPAKSRWEPALERGSTTLVVRWHGGRGVVAWQRSVSVIPRDQRDGSWSLPAEGTRLRLFGSGSGAFLALSGEGVDHEAAAAQLAALERLNGGTIRMRAVESPPPPGDQGAGVAPAGEEKLLLKFRPVSLRGLHSSQEVSVAESPDGSRSILSLKLPFELGGEEYSTEFWFEVSRGQVSLQPTVWIDGQAYTEGVRVSSRTDRDGRRRIGLTVPGTPAGKLVFTFVVRDSGGGVIELRGIRNGTAATFSATPVHVRDALRAFALAREAPRELTPPARAAASEPSPRPLPPPAPEAPEPAPAALARRPPAAPAAASPQLPPATDTGSTELGPLNLSPQRRDGGHGPYVSVEVDVHVEIAGGRKVTVSGKRVRFSQGRGRYWIELDMANGMHVVRGRYQFPGMSEPASVDLERRAKRLIITLKGPYGAVRFIRQGNALVEFTEDIPVRMQHESRLVPPTSPRPPRGGPSPRLPRPTGTTAAATPPVSPPPTPPPAPRPIAPPAPPPPPAPASGQAGLANRLIDLATEFAADPDSLEFKAVDALSKELEGATDPDRLTEIGQIVGLLERLETRATGVRLFRISRRTGEAGFVETRVPDFRETGPAIRRGTRRVLSETKRTAAGGIPFAVGEFGSNLLLGRPNPSGLDLLKTYVPLAIGGGVGTRLTNGAFHFLEGHRGFFPSFMASSRFSGFAGIGLRRAFPLFGALTLTDYVNTGHVEWAGMPLALTNIFAAQAVTHGLGRLFLRSAFVERMALTLRLIKQAPMLPAPQRFAVTLFGACLASLSDFTLMKAFGVAEERLLA